MKSETERDGARREGKVEKECITRMPRVRPPFGSRGPGVGGWRAVREEGVGRREGGRSRGVPRGCVKRANGAADRGGKGSRREGRGAYIESE
jgi:hypothetical protein